MAALLHFSSRRLTFDVSTSIGICKVGRRLLVSDGVNTDRSDAVTIVNGLSVLEYRFTLHCSFASDCIPLAALGILKDLVVSSGCRISGHIVECCSGAICVSNLEMAVLTMRAVDLRGYISNNCFIFIKSSFFLSRFARYLSIITFDISRSI